MSPAQLSEANHYRLLGNSGLRVSPFCLSTITFGTVWGWGADKQESRRIFDVYIDRGGNFIDTSNYYTNGISETFLGEFIGDLREQLVLGTQYTLSTRRGDPNAGGNHRKNMVQSLEASLKRLRTDYIDIYWLHCWEFRTPIEEVMRALDDLVRAGKVLYVGIAHTPAWKIAQGNTIAQLRGWSPFIGLQVEYSLAERTAERDLIPMAQDLGLGVIACAPLAGGILTGKYNLPENRQAERSNLSPRSVDRTTARASLNQAMGRLNERSLAIAAEVIATSAELGCSPAQVALNWLLQQSDIVCTVLSARTSQQLEENLGCLEYALTVTQMYHLDTISQIELGTPHNYLTSYSVQDIVCGGTSIANGSVRIEWH